MIFRFGAKQIHVLSMEPWLEVEVPSAVNDCWYRYYGYYGTCTLLVLLIMLANTVYQFVLSIGVCIPLVLRLLNNDPTAKRHQKAKLVTVRFAYRIEPEQRAERHWRRTFFLEII